MEGIQTIRNVTQVQSPSLASTSDICILVSYCGQSLHQPTTLIQVHWLATMAVPRRVQRAEAAREPMVSSADSSILSLCSRYRLRRRTVSMSLPVSQN